VARLLNGIHIVTDDFVNVYLVETGEGIVLIDAGLETTWRHVYDVLRGMGKSPKDIVAVIITHHHWDHVSSLGRIVRDSGAKVIAHHEEASLVEREAGVKVDVTVSDGDVVYGLKVIHTPGHTPGHIALLHEDTKSIFTGDLVYERGGELEEIPHRYSVNPEENRRSIAKLAGYDFENLLPAHGQPILGRGKEALLRLLERLKLSKQH
jgi:glyoxylase-like metal-dependent hydrolase (beta-lactamase superfamily II)